MWTASSSNSASENYFDAPVSSHMQFGKLQLVRKTTGRQTKKLWESNFIRVQQKTCRYLRYKKIQCTEQFKMKVLQWFQNTVKVTLQRFPRYCHVCFPLLCRVKSAELLQGKGRLCTSLSVVFHLPALQLSVLSSLEGGASDNSINHKTKQKRRRGRRRWRAMYLIYCFWVFFYPLGWCNLWPTAGRLGGRHTAFCWF